MGEKLYTFKMKREGKDRRFFRVEHAELTEDLDELIKTSAFQIVHWHPRYLLGGPGVPDPDAIDLEEIEAWNGKPFPLYMLDHSGISLSLSPFADRWDSGQVGYIFMKASNFVDERGENRIVLEAEQRKHAEAFIEYINCALVGEIYGYDIVRKHACTHCGSSTEEWDDGCGGFIGALDEKLLASMLWTQNLSAEDFAEGQREKHDILDKALTIVEMQRAESEAKQPQDPE